MKTNRLFIDGEFNTFAEFAGVCLPPFYIKVITSLEEMIEENENEVMIIFESKIGPVSFETEFMYTRDDKKIITDLLLPYYESIEDYVVCNRIKKLLDKF